RPPTSRTGHTTLRKIDAFQTGAAVLLWVRAGAEVRYGFEAPRVARAPWPETASGSADVDDGECLGQTPVRQAQRLRDQAGPLAQHRLEPGQVSDLRGVRPERRELARERVRDVDGVVGIRAADIPHLAHRPRLEAVVAEQLRERERIARVRVHRAGGRLP